MYLAIAALFLATFSVGTTEFVISGILPAVASDLGVTIPAAGLLISGYALGVVVGGPALTLSIARLPRKRALLIGLAVFLAAHLLCAMAPSYEVLMAGRAIAAASHGCINGLAIVAAARLATPETRGTAMGILLAAVPVANIIGVPLGTLVGTTFGWRMTFWMVIGFAVVATAAIAFVIKDADQGERAKSLSAQVSALWNQQVLTSYAMIVLMMMGFWALNTFVAPYLIEVGGLAAVWVPIVLLLTGIGGTIGTPLGGRLANRYATATIACVFPVAAVIYALFLVLAVGNGLAAGLLFGGLWLIGSLAITPLQTRVIAGAGSAPELASTLIASVFNLGIAVGAWIGSTALANGVLLEQLPLFGLVSCLPLTAIALGALVWERRAANAASASTA